MRKVLVILIASVTVLGLTAGQVFAGAQARIAGKIVDTDGNAVPGAAMYITCDQVKGYHKEVKLKDGCCFSTLILDATKNYRFHVEAPGYGPQELPFKVGIGTTDNVFDFELKTEAQLKQADQAQVLEQPGYKEYDEARKLLADGKKAEAEAKFEEAVAILPDEIPLWTALANLAYERGDNATALAHAKKCLDLDDEAPRCLVVAVNTARELGDESAESLMLLYQSLNPEDPATMFNEAAAFINKNDDAGARPLLEKCLEIDPEFAQCVFEYGMLLFRATETAPAKAQFEKYLEVAPEGKDVVTARQMLEFL